MHGNVIDEIIAIADRALAISQRDPAERNRDYLRRLRAGEIDVSPSQ